MTVNVQEATRGGGRRTQMLIVPTEILDQLPPAEEAEPERRLVFDRPGD